MYLSPRIFFIRPLSDSFFVDIFGGDEPSPYYITPFQGVTVRIIRVAVTLPRDVSLLCAIVCVSPSAVGAAYIRVGACPHQLGPPRPRP